MALLDDIKKRMFAAMKSQQTVEKEILRVAVGEITTSAARGDSGELSDAEVQAVLKKLVKSNSEALSQATDASTKETLEREIAVLQSFLPRALSIEEIVAELAPVKDSIQAAPAQGPAMGIAMKTLKAAGKSAEAKDVTQAVARLRGS